MGIEAWNEYRGWAKRARQLRNSTSSWNRASLASVCLAALFGAAAAWLGQQQAWSGTLSLLAALFSAIAAFVGKNILAEGDERNWLRARAIAEGIKSECYRFAAKAGKYAGDNALELFVAQRVELEKQGQANGISSSEDKIADGADKRQPPAEMTSNWYVENRVNDQTSYYDAQLKKQESALKLLRGLSFLSGFIAVVLGVLGGSKPNYGFTPWIGAITTISTAIVAVGLLDRRKYLIASYAAMSSSLGRIMELFRSGSLTLQDFVTRTEDLLESEHKAWLDQMTQTVTVPTVASDAVRN